MIDWSVCVCVCVDFSDVKCSYLKSSCFVVRDLLMSRLGQSSILEQRTSNWLRFRWRILEFWRPGRRRKGNFCVSTCFCFLCLIQFYFCRLFLVSGHRPRDSGPVMHISSLFFSRFHLCCSIALLLSFVLVTLQHSLPPSLFLHLSFTVGGMWAMLCMTVHKFQM